MKRSMIVAVILTGLFALSSAASDRKNTITVSGKAEEKVGPDIAYVTLYAQADGILMVDAVRKVTTMVEEIVTAIQTQTDTVKNISVIDIALGEKRQRHWGADQQDGTPRPQVARRIRISCKPIPEKIYEVIDQGIRAGALMQLPSTTTYSDDIRSVAIYGLAQSSEIVDRVMRAAMANARVEAEKLAILAGKTVGDVVTIGCSGASLFRFPVRIMGRQSDYPVEHVGTNPEEITISHSVSVTYELQ